MDLRTGPGRYRKVMSYEYKLHYGNDLNNAHQKDYVTTTWEESFVADFTEFFGRLFQS